MVDVWLFNVIISSLYTSSALHACLSVSLSVSLFKHLANIISVYCRLIIMYELPTMFTEGLTLYLCVREQRSNMVCVCVLACRSLCMKQQICCCCHNQDVLSRLLSIYILMEGGTDGRTDTAYVDGCDV